MLKTKYEEITANIRLDKRAKVRKNVCAWWCHHSGPMGVVMALWVLKVKKKIKKKIIFQSLWNIHRTTPMLNCQRSQHTSGLHGNRRQWRWQHVQWCDNPQFMYYNPLTRSTNISAHYDSRRRRYRCNRFVLRPVIQVDEEHNQRDARSAQVISTSSHGGANEQIKILLLSVGKRKTTVWKNAFTTPHLTSQVFYIFPYHGLPTEIARYFVCIAKYIWISADPSGTADRKAVGEQPVKACLQWNVMLPSKVLSQIKEAPVLSQASRGL